MVPGRKLSPAWPQEVGEVSTAFRWAGNSPRADALLLVVLGFCSLGTLWKSSLGMLAHLLIR